MIHNGIVGRIDVPVKAIKRGVFADEATYGGIVVTRAEVNIPCLGVEVLVIVAVWVGAIGVVDELIAERVVIVTANDLPEVVSELYVVAVSVVKVPAVA